MNASKLLYELRPRACIRFRAFPVFGPIMDDGVSWFQDHGYTTLTIRNHLKGIDKLVRWLKRRRGGLAHLNEKHLSAAYEHFHCRKPDAAGTIRAVARFLRERDLLPQGPKPAALQSERQLEAFGSYLREVRGRAKTTIEGHPNRLRLFLRFLDFDRRSSAVRRLQAEQVEAFIEELGK